jgi:hypothetical protein
MWNCTNVDVLNVNDEEDNLSNVVITMNKFVVS